MLKRQGFWVNVEIGSLNGWLKVSMVNFAGPNSGTISIDTGRMGTGNIVSTSAVRGLSAKDLVDGKPNFDELHKLESLNMEMSSVLTFMSEGNVKPQEIKVTLSAPKPISNSVAGTSSGSAGSNNVTTKQKKDEDW